MRLANLSGQNYISNVSVQEIKAAVQRLSLEERAEVAACLHSWNEDAWDEQMNAI